MPRGNRTDSEGSSSPARCKAKPPLPKTTSAARPVVMASVRAVLANTSSPRTESRKRCSRTNPELSGTTAPTSRTMIATTKETSSSV